MIYCTKCGNKNEDDAIFCNKCGAPLTGAKRDVGKEWENKCEEECTRGPRWGSIFWGVIVVLIGLWIVFEFGLKNIRGLPDWVYKIEFWWVVPVIIIGFVIIILGIKMMVKKK